MGEYEGVALGEVEGDIEGNLGGSTVGILLRLSDGDALGDVS